MQRGTAVSSKTRAHASRCLTVRGPLAVENASGFGASRHPYIPLSF